MNQHNGDGAPQNEKSHSVFLQLYLQNKVSIFFFELAERKGRCKRH